MMNSLIPIILSLISIVNCFNITIQTQLEKDSSNDINGLLLTPYHEGAGINYGFASDIGADYIYTPNNHSLFVKEPAFNGVLFTYFFVDTEDQAVGDNNANGNSQGNVVQISTIGFSEVEIDKDNLIRVRGSNAFFACKNIPELGGYAYSSTAYAITFYPFGNPPSGCIYVKLVADLPTMGEFADDNVSDSYSLESTAFGAPTNAAAEVSSLPSSTADASSTVDASSSAAPSSVAPSSSDPPLLSSSSSSSSSPSSSTDSSSSSSTSSSASKSSSDVSQDGAGSINSVSLLSLLAIFLSF